MKELREVGLFLPNTVREIFCLFPPSFSHVHHCYVTLVVSLYQIAVFRFLYLLHWAKGGRPLLSFWRTEAGISWISGQPHPLIFKTLLPLPRFHFLGRRKSNRLIPLTAGFVTSPTRINTRSSKLKYFHWNQCRHASFFCNRSQSRS